MTGTILGLFGTALAAALADLLAPGEGRRGLRQALHFLTALAVLLLLLHPLPGLLRAGADAAERDWPLPDGGTADYEARLSDAVAARGAAELEEGLYAWLERAHGVTRDNCRVALRFAEDGTPARVSVTLSGGALLVDPQPIEDALRRMLNCEAEVR